MEKSMKKYIELNFNDTNNKEKFLSILFNRKKIGIRRKLSFFIIPINSMKKIFNLLKENPVEYILFLYEDSFNQNNNEVVNNPVLINEIGTSYDKNNLKRVFESDPLIKKIDLYITFFYFLIGCFLLFHLCLYLFGPDVRKNYYFIFYSLNLIFILLLV